MSEVRLGVVLLQDGVGVLKPIVFIIHKMLEDETRYLTIEMACLAIKRALDSLKYNLLGREFVLETDHRALQWLHKMRNSNN
jgi:hypothetical protein